MKEKKKKEKSSLNTKWLELELKNPIILASLTLISNTKLEEHLDFYVLAEKLNYGAIILGSVIPYNYGDSNFKETINYVLPISYNNYIDNLGFSLQGPLHPNVSSQNYGINLLINIKKKVSIPVIASILAIGTEENLISSALEFQKSGADGLEFNFSCPSISNFNEINDLNLERILPSNELFNKLDRSLKIKYTIKVSPNENIADLFQSFTLGIKRYVTYSNAHTGLFPPSLNPPHASNFVKDNYWTTSGFYGALNKYKNMEGIASLRTRYDKEKLGISAVGGIYDGQSAVEYLLLGADTIQLGSIIFIRKLKIVKQIISYLNSFMLKNSYSNIQEIIGLSIPFIKNDIQNIDAYKLDEFKKFKNTYFINSKCTLCLNCYQMGCLAIKKDKEKNVFIDKVLCSGCGWCKNLCFQSAINIIYNK